MGQNTFKKDFAKMLKLKAISICFSFYKNVLQQFQAIYLCDMSINFVFMYVEEMFMFLWFYVFSF